MIYFDKVTILGTGPMAQDYFKVLNSFGIKVEAIGNTQEGCEKFKLATGTDAVSGGYEQWLSKNTVGNQPIIVALTEDYLGVATANLIAKGARSILVEKPGAAIYSEALELGKIAEKHKAQVYVGYNRRFYSSVIECQKRVAEDGGVDSFFFEFTEWGHVVEKKVCTQQLKDNWYWHNSTHVVDLAFFLGGWPQKMSGFRGGSLHWHQSASKYVGAGKTEAGALFNYMSNWAAPGRWVVEIITKKNRYYFKPLEKLQVQKLGTVAVEEIAIDNADDLEFKPGLKKQVGSFLNLPGFEKYKANLVTLNDQCKHLDWFMKIENPDQ